MAACFLGLSASGPSRPFSARVSYLGPRFEYDLRRLGLALACRPYGGRPAAAGRSSLAPSSRGPPPRSSLARGAPAPPRSPASLRSAPVGVAGATGVRLSLRSHLLSAGAWLRCCFRGFLSTRPPFPPASTPHGLGLTPIGANAPTVHGECWQEGSFAGCDLRALDRHSPAKAAAQGFRIPVAEKNTTDRYYSSRPAAAMQERIPFGVLILKCLCAPARLLAVVSPLRSNVLTASGVCPRTPSLSAGAIKHQPKTTNNK